MAEVNGQLSSCDRCGMTIFRKAIGEGEADGGYTRWNNFEPYPPDWGFVYLPDPQRATNYKSARCCPDCLAFWASLLAESFVKGTLLDPLHKGGEVDARS